MVGNSWMLKRYKRKITFLSVKLQLEKYVIARYTLTLYLHILFSSVILRELSVLQFGFHTQESLDGKYTVQLEK